VAGGATVTASTNSAPVGSAGQTPSVNPTGWVSTSSLVTKFNH
jgi:hypothetical protein